MERQGLIVVDGQRKVTVELTVDQWSFVVSGLRDCADSAKKRREEGDEELMQENLQLAATIEYEMLMAFPSQLALEYLTERTPEDLVQLLWDKLTGAERRALELEAVTSTY